MPALILDTRTTASALNAQLKTDTAAFTQRTGTAPALVLISVGEDRAIFDYIRIVTRSASRAGIRAYANLLPADTSAEEVQRHLSELNQNPAIDAISLQLPLPPHLHPRQVASFIAPEKEVEGLHPANAGTLDEPNGAGMAPPPAMGALKLLSLYSINPQGRHAVVVGRNTIIGRPVASLLTAANATVTLCHSKTTNLAALIRQAEILVVAVQKPGLITGAMLRPGAVVIDFGINYVGENVTGDVDFASAHAVAGAITPMPGGTGPLTVIALLQNTLKAAQQRRGAPQNNHHDSHPSLPLGDALVVRPRS